MTPTEPDTTAVAVHPSEPIYDASFAPLAYGWRAVLHGRAMSGVVTRSWRGTLRDDWAATVLEPGYLRGPMRPTRRAAVLAAGAALHATRELDTE